MTATTGALDDEVKTAHFDPSHLQSQAESKVLLNLKHMKMLSDLMHRKRVFVLTMHLRGATPLRVTII